MTKEEIIRQYEPHPNKAEVSVIGKMMDEFAKQQAIDYCGWYSSIGYLLKVKDKKDYSPGESYMKDHEQLYREFIEQQNKE